MTQADGERPAAGRVTEPRLVLVTGHPGAGKSRLAERLAARAGLPLLAKDDFQEVLFDALPASGADLDTRTAANLVMLRAARRVLCAGLSCVLDSNLEPARWRGPVAALLAESGALLVQVRLHAAGEVLLARVVARAGRRHPGHGDGQRLAVLRERLLGPPLDSLELPGEVLELATDCEDEAAERAVIERVTTLLR